MLFSDWVLSWVANPLMEVGGVVLPMLFNSTYHAGADLALGVMFPVAIVQYVMLSSIHEELNNLSLRHPVTRTDVVDDFIRRRYAKVVAITFAVSGYTAALVALFAPDLMARVGGSPLSLGVLHVAAGADVLLSVFVVNSSFMMLLNRPKTLAVISAIGACLVVSLGVLLMPLGFQYLVYAYLAACASAAAASTLVVLGLLKRPSSLFYARFI